MNQVQKKTQTFSDVFNNQSIFFIHFFLSIENSIIIKEETISEIDKAIAEWDDLAIESINVFSF